MSVPPTARVNSLGEIKEGFFDCAPRPEIARHDFRGKPSGSSARQNDEIGRSSGHHSDLPARKRASLVRKKSEIKIDTEEVTTA
jgi:hypothetical protein